MATKSAGRVSIRVLPDSTRFKEDLEKSLRRIERQLKAKIEAELYLSRESLAKLKRQIESLVVKIKPSIELNISLEEIEALKAKIEAMKPKVDVDLNTVVASRRIASLARTRTVTLIPMVMGGNLDKFNGFITHMKGLAGLNILGDSWKEGLHFIQNVDRSAVQIGTLITKMGALAAMAGTTAANLIAIISQVASIGNLALLAPAFMTGLGISVGILVAAFKDMKTVLADLGPRMKAFQDSISADFWREAAGPIRDMTNYLLDIIHTTAGTTNTARSLGQFFGEMANSIKDLLTAEKLNTMFDRMNKSIDILKGAIRPLTNAFINLGLHGSKYFERFSTWIVKVSNQFDDFITRSSENGNLDRWTENAIQGMKDLGSLIAGVTRIFAALNKAAVASGAMNLGNFADAFNRAADAMNTPRFQNTLVLLFEGMRKATDGILVGVGKLGPALEIAMPTIARVFESIGSIATKVGEMLAGLISNPTLLAGFEGFIKNIDIALGNLGPAVKPFADSLGGALDIMGKVLVAVSEVGAAFATKLMPKLDLIGKQFESLVEPFKKTLLDTIEKLGPLVDTLNTSVVTPLIALIKDQLLPFFEKLTTFLSPTFKLLLEEIGSFLEKDLYPGFKKVNGEMDKANQNDGPTKFRDVLKEIMDFLPKLADPKKLMPGFNGNWLGGIFTGQADNFMKDWENFKRPINEWWNNTVWPGFEGMLLDGLGKVEEWSKNEFGPAVRKWVESLPGMILDAFLGMLGLKTVSPEEMDKFWSGIGKSIEDGYNGFKKDFQAWLATLNPMQDILDALFGKSAKSTDGTSGNHIGGGAGGKGMAPGAKLGPGFFDVEAEKTWFQTMFDGINTKVGTFGTGFMAAMELWKPGINESWTTFWEGLKTNPTGSLGTIATTTASTLVGMGISIAGFIAQNAPAWAANWETMTTNVTTALTDTNLTTGEKIASMGVSIAAFIATTAPVWATHWSTLQTNVTNSMTNSNLTTGEKIAAMGISIASFLSSVTATWGPGWTTFQTTVRLAWAVITGNTKSGVTDAAGEAGKLPERSKSAIGDTKWTLYSSGRALVGGFAAGMDSNLGVVTSAAIAVAAAVAAAMPHSPAKMGPLSGKGYTTHSGRALVKDLAGGMMDNMNHVKKATAAIAGAASFGSLDLNNDLGNNGVVIDRRQVTIQTYNPVAEPTSRTIEKAANTLRMATGI